MDEGVREKAAELRAGEVMLLEKMFDSEKKKLKTEPSLQKNWRLLQIYS